MKYKEKRVPQSVSLSIKQLEALVAIAEKEGGFLSTHVSCAVDEYLIKKGYLKPKTGERYV